MKEISLLVSMFYSTYNLPVKPVKVELVSKLRIINTPYGKRQAHGTADAYTGLIELHRSHWEGLGPEERKELLWHELAHIQGCRHHVKERAHIMNPHAPEVYWINHKEVTWPSLEISLGGYLENCLPNYRFEGRKIGPGRTFGPPKEGIK